MLERCALLAMTALVVCMPSVTVVTSGWVGGVDRVYSDAEWTGHGERDVVIDQASRDLACPVAELVATRPHERAYVVVGCGRRGVFVSVMVSKIGTAEDRRIEYWQRGVNVSAPAAPPATPLGDVSDPQLSSNSSWSNVQAWVRLVAQGAKDLSCAPDQVTPDFLPQGRAPALPVVEGCGKRATYLSEANAEVFRLSAIVAMGGDAGAP